MAKRKRKTRKRTSKFSFSRFYRRLRRRIRRSGKLLLVICISALVVLFVKDKFFNLGTNRTTVFATDYNGIDVSKYQGNIDWNKVSEDSHIQFVYIKASEGSGNFDSKYNK